MRCATGLQRERQHPGNPDESARQTPGHADCTDPPPMTRKLQERLWARAERTEFGKRLLEISKQIESDFDGRERERLLALVDETLERHFEIRETAERTREALAKLRSDQHTLLRLFDFITASPDRETIH